jgi:hypothetical protein
MAEVWEKRKRGRPRKSRDLLTVLGTLNSTRERAWHTAESKPLPKPPLNPELDIWHMTFVCGYDFFHNLPEIGLRGDARVDPTVRRAAKAAWQRLGAAFMQTSRDSLGYGKVGPPPDINGATIK